MRVLLIDNDLDCLERIKPAIEKHYVVDVAHNGQEGVYLSQVNDYAAIVVDGYLPDMPSTEFCKSAREASVETPVIVTCSCDDPLTLPIAILDAGADTIVPRAKDAAFLLANLRATIRRSFKLCSYTSICVGDLVIDIKNREVTKLGKRINLRKKEYEVLQYLAVNKNLTVSKERLLEQVWEDGLDIFSNTLEVTIKYLRDKIDTSFGTKTILTVHGFGYKLVS